jgi:hypothetical protein
VWIEGFGDSGVDYQVVCFLNDFGARDSIDSAVRTRIWYAFNRAGINIPFPVRDVRVQEQAAKVSSDRLDIALPERLAVFERVALFETIPRPVVELLAQATTPVLYAPTECIVVEGDTGNELFIVVSGTVAVLTHSAEGERITLATLDHGNVFGELSLVTGVRGATVVAETETVLLRLCLDDFRRIISQVPELGESLLTQIVERQGQFGRPETLGLDPNLGNGAVRNALFDRIRRFFSS